MGGRINSMWPNPAAECGAATRRGRLRHRPQCGWALSAGSSVREAGAEGARVRASSRRARAPAARPAVKLRPSPGLGGKESAMGQSTGRRG